MYNFIHYLLYSVDMLKLVDSFSLESWIAM